MTPRNKMNDRKFYIENMINDRAKQSFHLTITAENIVMWHIAWIKAAEEIKTDFEKEGLTNSVDYVQRQIEWVQTFIDREQKNAILEPLLKDLVKEINDTGLWGGPANERYNAAKRELENA